MLTVTRDIVERRGSHLSLVQGLSPMSRKPSETPIFYRGRERDLTQELFAYYQQAASCISDPTELEQMLDALQASDESSITKQQSELRARQIQFVRNLLREKERVEALQDVYEEAMDQAYEVGSDYYRETATSLTELEADAHDALEHEKYDEFAGILTRIKGISDQAARLKGSAGGED
jgi:hypothetical protein